MQLYLPVPDPQTCILVIFTFHSLSLSPKDTSSCQDGSLEHFISLKEQNQPF